MYKLFVKILSERYSVPLFPQYIVPKFKSKSTAYHCTCSGSFTYIVEVRYNERLRDLKSLFAITRFCYIEVVFIHIWLLPG